MGGWGIIVNGLERRRWSKGLGLFRRLGAWVVPARGGLDFRVFGGEGLEGDSGGGGYLSTPQPRSAFMLTKYRK